jgi:hypothetical protein
MGDNVIYICYIYNIYFTIIRAYTSTRVHIRATYIGYIYRTSIRVCIYRFMKKPYTGIRRSLHIKFGHLLTLFTQLCLCECVSVCVLHLHTHMQGGSRSIPSSKLCSPHAHHIHMWFWPTLYSYCSHCVYVLHLHTHVQGSSRSIPSPKRRLLSPSYSGGLIPGDSSSLRSQGAQAAGRWVVWVVRITKPWWPLRLDISGCHTSHPGRVTQIHSHTDTQIHGYTDAQLHRYTDTQLRRYTNTRLHRYTVTQLHRYTDTQIHSYADTQLHRYTDTQSHSYADAQIHSCTVTQIHRYTVTQLH